MQFQSSFSKLILFFRCLEKMSKKMEFSIVDDDRLKLSDTDDESDFNNFTRDWIVAVSILMIVYSWSYNKVSYYLDKKERYSRDKDERVIQRVAQHFSACAFTLAILFTFLLPFSMLVNEILRLDPDAWYFQWLSQTMIEILWTCIIYSRRFCLFCFLPFTYFWLETEAASSSPQSVHVHESSGIQSFVNDYTRNSNYFKKLRSRWIDALTIYVLTICTLLLLTAVLTRFENLGFRLVKFFTEGYSFMSVCAIDQFSHLIQFRLVFFCQNQLFRNFSNQHGVILSKKIFENSAIHISAPFGFKYIFHFIHINFLRKPLYLISSEDLYKAEYIYENARRRFRSSSSELNLQNLKTAEKYLKELKERKKASTIIMKVVYPVVVVCLVVLPVFTVLHTVFHIIELGFKLLTEKHHENFIVGVLVWFVSFFIGEDQSELEMGKYSLSLFGLPGVILEILTISYIHASACLGIYSSKTGVKLKPTIASTSTQKMLLNSFLILTISSALPKLCITLDFTDPYVLINRGRKKNRLLDSTKVKLFLNVVFAISTGLTILAFLKANFIRLQKYFFGRKLNINPSVDRLSSQDSSLDSLAQVDLTSCSVTSSKFD